MFKVGDVTRTRDGNTAEILCILERPKRGCVCPALARLTLADGSQAYETYTIEGNYIPKKTSEYDLLPMWTSFPQFGGIVMIRADAEGKMIVQWGPGGPPKFDPARNVHVARLVPGTEKKERRAAIVVHHLKSSGESPGSLAVRVRNGDGHFLAIFPDTGNHDTWLGRRWSIFNYGEAVVNVGGLQVAVRRDGNALEAINLPV